MEEDERGDQRARAQEMARCLTAAGVGASTRELEDGQLWLDFPGQPWAMAVQPGDGLLTPTATRQEEREAQLERLNYLTAPYYPDSSDPSAPFKDQPFLIVGDTDHSHTFVACLDQTGYTDPVAENNPAEELQTKLAVAEATNRWIACARENGFPALKDLDPPQADDWATTPVAVLPGDITDTELRELVRACPVFDIEAAAAMVEELLALGPDVTPEERSAIEQNHERGPEPAIGFDLPGWDGNSGGISSGVPAYQRGMELQAIINEAKDAFYADAQRRAHDVGWEL